MGYSVVNPKTHKTLFLHKKLGLRVHHLYFFGYEIVDSVDLPEDMEVKFSKRSGHPYVAKKEISYDQA